MLRVERLQRALQRRQPVERHAGEIVMLEMVVGIQEREIPEPVAAHQRAPFRRIVRIDVVVLPETVQRERDRKHEEHRDDIRAQRRGAPGERPYERKHCQVRRDRHLALERDAPLQRLRICRAFLPRRAEIDREERRRAVQQLEPARIDRGRQVMALRIVFVRPELRVVIEMPPRELAGRDAARHRVEPPERALRRGTAALEDGVVHHFVQQHREVEDRQPLHERERNPDQRIRNRDERPGAQPENCELPRGDQQVPRRVLLVERDERLTGQRAAELGPQRRSVLAVMMRFHGT